MNWNNWLYADRLGEEKQTPKPQTNADRIRAMSDEELADFLRLDVCHKIKGDNRICNGWCDECVLEWLKQPAEV